MKLNRLTGSLLESMMTLKVVEEHPVLLTQESSHRLTSNHSFDAVSLQSCEDEEIGRGEHEITMALTFRTDSGQ